MVKSCREGKATQHDRKTKQPNTTEGVRYSSHTHRSSLTTPTVPLNRHVGSLPLAINVKHSTSMYILGLVFGIFAGLITVAFSFIPSLSSPVYLVCDALVEIYTLVALYYICDSSPAS